MLMEITVGVEQKYFLYVSEQSEEIPESDIR